MSNFGKGNITMFLWKISNSKPKKNSTNAIKQVLIESEMLIHNKSIVCLYDDVLKKRWIGDLA